ncbi:MAG: DUF3800 domain-containing protein [Rhodospirillales bacterium]|nr:DUF3800 domain-containing protein [Rhodospirillales bacterium]
MMAMTRFLSGGLAGRFGEIDILRLFVQYPDAAGRSALFGSRKLGFSPTALFLLLNTIIGCCLHLLYLDESGHPADNAQRHLVLAGLSVFERQGYFLSREIDRIAARFDAAAPTKIELHAAPMLQGRGIWKAVPLADRMAALFDALDVIARAPESLRLFAVAVHKASYDADPMHVAFEAVFRHVERGDDRFFRIIKGKFDQDAGRVHGFAHLYRPPAV